MTSRALKTQSSMNERPILMSAPMVRAILDGRKTQTRRVMKLQPSMQPTVHFGQEAKLRAGESFKGGLLATWPGESEFDYCDCHCPYGGPGDRLWVREEHFSFGHWEPIPGVRTKVGRQKWKFVADSEGCLFEAPTEFRKGRHHKDPATPAWHKRLARFMPRRASRITLEITNVRVERLQEISDEDAKAEGVTVKMDAVIAASMTDGKETPARMEFWDLWRSINGPDSWDKNPWVWAISFKRIEP